MAFHVAMLYQILQKSVQKKLEIIPLRTRINLNCISDSVRTAQFKRSASVIKTNQLMLYKEIIAVCAEIHIEHVNTVWAERRIA
jgi:hypothetical protein